MTHDTFLKLAGIDGESMDASYPKAIQVLTWDWSAGQPSAMHQGSGGGAGKCKVDDLAFEHYVDRASPNLLRYCLTGKPISRAELITRKAGGTPLEYLKITMEDVLITRVTLVGNTNMILPREEVRLAFARVRQEYTIQNASGGSAGTVSMGYDIKANKAL